MRCAHFGRTVFSLFGVLAVRGGAVCETEIEKRCVKRLRIIFRDGADERRFRVFLDGREIMY